MAAPQRWGAVPAPPVTFVGRTRELARVARLWSRSRLVVVIGPAGVGETAVSRRAVGGRARPARGRRRCDARRRPPRSARGRQRSLGDPPHGRREPALVLAPLRRGTVVRSHRRARRGSRERFAAGAPATRSLPAPRSR